MISDLQREAMVSIKVAEGMMEMKSVQSQLSGEGTGEDPVVALKAKELEQRAAKDQAEIALKQEGVKNEQASIAENAQADSSKNSIPGKNSPRKGQCCQRKNLCP
jgi:hypothetical protein